MAELKTRPTTADVNTVLDSVADERRREDARTVCGMMQKITRREPVLWGTSIIGFGTYTYVYESGRSGTTPMAGFSPRKANMTFYLGDKFDDAAALYARLGKHRKSKACVYINKLADVDLEVLEEIVRRDFIHTRNRAT